jgi:tetratricopeptide (TPR) repeat protein
MIKTTLTLIALFSLSILLSAAESKPPVAPPSESDVATKALNNFVDENMRTVVRPEAKPQHTINDLKLHPTEEFIHSTNLLHTNAPAATNEAWQVKRHWSELRVARELRQSTNAMRAIINLVSLLETVDAPQEVKMQGLYELGLAAQQEHQTLRAYQIFSQFVDRYRDDMLVPEALLRQGMIQREMGLKELALSKFYAVLSTSLKLRDGDTEYYQTLVLKAQAEIADTYYQFGDYAMAANFYERLLALKTDMLDKPRIHYKQIQSLRRGGDYISLIPTARRFLAQHKQHEEVPEIRYMLSDALKKQDRNAEALDEVLLLLNSQKSLAASDPGKWIYWKQRTGNTIANELYKEGDYLSALEIYQNLAKLNNSVEWQLPAWYQMGLVFERLRSPGKAGEIYASIVARKTELSDKSPPSLTAIVDMAKWRHGFLNWQVGAERSAAILIGSSPDRPRGLPGAPPPEPPPVVKPNPEKPADNAAGAVGGAPATTGPAAAADPQAPEQKPAA